MDTPDTDEIITPEQFATEYKIAKGTQAVLRSRGQLPYLRLGGGRIIRYRRSEVAAWIAAGAVPMRKAGAR